MGWCAKVCNFALFVFAVCEAKCGKGGVKFGCNPSKKTASEVEAAFLKSCQGVDSDHRPKAYESSALPLSYSGDF